MGARLWGAIVAGGRAGVVGGRAELTATGGLWVVEVDGGAVTAGAVDVGGTEVGAENCDGDGTRVWLSPPVEVATYSDPRITASATSEMVSPDAR